MRSPKVLASMVDDSKAITGHGVMPMDLLALDDEEVQWFKTYMKGKRGIASLGIRLGKPGDERPIAERFQFTPEPPKKRNSVLTEDGY